MKINAKVSAAVASAIAMAGAGAVHAGAIVPSTNDGSLMFFLENTTTGQTLTEVLPQDLNSLFSAAQATAGSPQGGVINTITGNANFADVFSDSNYTSFISANSGATLAWGVLSEGYIGTGATARPTGAARTIATDLLASDVLAVSQATGVTTGLPSGFGTDVGNLNIALGAGSSTISSPSILGSNGGAGGTLNSLYGTSINATGIGPGTAVTLYGVTGNGTKIGSGYAYSLGSIVFNLANATVSFTGNPVGAVPLPAAVWLLGSGLLGLAGVGRRRSVQAA
jgi:hypothetical protein